MMNKKLFAAAIVALSGAFAVNAQQVCTPQQACKEQQCAPGQDCRKQCPALRGDKDARMCNPFEGLNLSADQQSKLQALQQKCRTERKEAKAAEKATRREAGNERRKQMLADIKGILSPEQYVQFLENNFVRDGRDGRQFCKGKDMQRRDGKKMRRPDGQNKTDNQNK